MAVTTKLDVAQTAFEEGPTNGTAAMFLSVLHEYFDDGMIEEETFHDGLHKVEHYLWKGGSVVSA